ncbi:hypothetical protein EGI16_21525 [Chryseobacterium sp. G0240]|uniref:hypothetical protein n=1 Tax=Chryseobacterium sp. G0240 TaxID=2487066 RepID=UPI000F44FA67|nr:hypothetical protein [Chryseobacterium sp. G0240]ROH98418.1 hypothetical protein EGI16_21525 [Chryseobacterium sp. G0240]
MKVFDLDIKTLAVLWTPPFKRSAVFVGFLYSFSRPLIDLYNQFLSSRKQNMIRLNFNYQTCSLEHRLNDAFDPLQRRIKISRSKIYDSIFLYTEAEDNGFNNKTQWLHSDENPIYLRTEGELYTVYDFIVQIPNTNINLFQLQSEIDYYKLPTKQYKIELLP